LMIVQKATHLGNWSRNGATAVWGTRVTGPNTYKNDPATPSWLLVFISFLFIFLSHLLFSSSSRRWTYNWWTVAAMSLYPFCFHPPSIDITTRTVASLILYVHKQFCRQGPCTYTSSRTSLLTNYVHWGKGGKKKLFFSNVFSIR
jgi:hypothetical protein